MFFDRKKYAGFSEELGMFKNEAAGAFPICTVNYKAFKVFKPFFIACIFHYLKDIRF